MEKARLDNIANKIPPTERTVNITITSRNFTFGPRSIKKIIIFKLNITIDKRSNPNLFRKKHK